MSRRYLLVTPCRNEAAYLQTTIDAVAAQTVPPTRWIVIDDGSTDDTPEILARAGESMPYLEVVRREDRGRRSVGPGVIDAFYAGYERIDPGDFDYVCKFDADLDLPRRYFETVMERMEATPRIGTCSGKPYFRSGDEMVSEACGDEMSVGMIKFYRRSCFEQIGGFVREVMWDGIDCHRCRMLGWIACSWDDPELRFEHLRPMGSSQVGILTGRRRHGFGQYFMGTGLGYMAASALFRCTRPPLVLGGMSMLYGYLESMARRRPRYDDPAFRAFLRAYQAECLRVGKTVATARLNDRQARCWHPPVETGSASTARATNAVAA